jgi:hypothetical protein
MLIFAAMNTNLLKVILAALLAIITAISGIINNNNTQSAKKEMLDTLKSVETKVISRDTNQPELTKYITNGNH